MEFCARRRSWLSALLIVAIVAIVSAADCRSAYAFNSDQRAVGAAGIYGTLVGTLVGLATLPMTRNSRSVLLGSSVGLYLGFAVGIYHINNRDDPGNPFRQQQRQSDASPNEVPPPVLALDVPVLRF